LSLTPINRRAALLLLSILPLVARLAVQARPTPVRRVFPGMYHTLLLDPDGTLKSWSGSLSLDSSGELGQGNVNTLEKYTLYPIPGLSNVVSAGAGWDSSFAVLAAGRILSWGSKGICILGITPLAEVEVSAEARWPSRAERLTRKSRRRLGAR
jgi:alpha-tubulin suppressor-like RCC1 family protein